MRAAASMLNSSGLAKPALAYVMGRELGGAEEWDKEKGEAALRAAADKQEREESWKMVDMAFKLSENDPVGATQFLKKAATKNQYVAKYGDVQFKSKTQDKWSTIANSKTGETYLINTDLLMSNQELPDEQAQELTRQVAERYDLVVDPFRKEFGEFQAKEPQKAQETIQEIRKGVFKIFDPAPEIPKTPYTKGKRETYVGQGGFDYEGTYQGQDDKNEPVFSNAVKKAKGGDGGGPNTVYLEGPNGDLKAMDKKDIPSLQKKLDGGYRPYKDADLKVLEEMINLKLLPELNKERGKAGLPPRELKGSKPAAPSSANAATLSGNNVVVNGKAYPLNPDGTVSIDGKKFKVNK